MIIKDTCESVKCIVQIGMRIIKYVQTTIASFCISFKIQYADSFIFLLNERNPPDKVVNLAPNNPA